LLEGDRLGRDDDLRAELAGLDDGPFCEFRAGDPGREAEVVLDPRRRPRLAACRDSLKDGRGQAFRGAVDGCCEAGRAGPTMMKSCAVLPGVGRRRPSSWASSALAGLRRTWSR
jgi:hypothetical protein